MTGALALPLCLIRSVLADPSQDRPIEADIVVTGSTYAADAPAQLDFFATAEIRFTTEFDISDFDVELFEAALPRDVPAPVEHDAAAATLQASSPDEGQPPLKSAADHPPTKIPAAKQPLRSSRTRAKTGNPARTSLPAARKVGAAQPATNPHARPHAAKPDRGPRELFIARLPPSDRDEVMPALRPIPVMRVALPPPPALALK
ncbi:MAG TPA: hypothetical protein VHT04_05280 [Stellaceae bacterium]|nr:hypothetical protein [Stellaceae bacterium]